MYTNLCDMSYENGYKDFRSNLPERYKLDNWLQEYAPYWKKGQVQRLYEIEEIHWAQCGYR